MNKEKERSPYSRIDSLLRKTKEAVEESSKEINDIVVETKENIHRLKDELIEIEARIAAHIMMVDSTERKISELRTKCDSFEKALGKDDFETKKIQKKIKECTVKANALRNEEKTLRIRRDSVERYLRENGELLQKSEKALKQVLVAISYLNLEDMSLSDTSVVRVINASDSEKTRMSRDIHDGPAQSLVNIMLKAEYANKLVESASTATLKAELREIRVIAKETLADIRRIIFDLMPYSMAEYGLFDTVKTLFQRSDTVDIDFVVRGDKQIKDKVLENNLFRIIQEIYFNILKHSKAKQAVFRVNSLDDRIELYVKDDGIGFDQALPSKGYGLVSMRDRVELLNGRFDIVSKVGSGTEIRVTIPKVEDHEKNICS